AAVGIGPHGLRGPAGVIAERRDGELELVDADDRGRRLLLVWNVDGASELELLEPATGIRTMIDAVPGAVITGCVLSRDGHHAVVTVDDPAHPPQLWCLHIETGRWRQLTEPVPIRAPLVRPELISFDAHDGLPLTGWLYRSVAHPLPGPAVIFLHGGPESQERPTFNANHQALAAAGITVLAPNIRGSSGFGRSFAHADDRYGRYDAITDVHSCARHLLVSGLADPARIAVAGRSYGGYATLAALTGFPDMFAAGADICGMSDLLTFYRDTEPWIAAAAVTKYGDPDHDRVLLEDLSPLRHISRIKAPLLVVHGELDTNVPITEATQVVTALQAAGGCVSYLELAGEGHEYRARSARLMLLDALVEFFRRALQP
ncbi:MAG: S9 family peptidase, partial [Actinobacteria bacterium]|nr:S9 family peptidase [Actinomycetota bacterium]